MSALATTDVNCRIWRAAVCLLSARRGAKVSDVYGTDQCRNLPYRTHCYSLPLLCNCMPIFDEICRRSLKFLRSCLSTLVCYVAQFSVTEDHNSSPVGRNAFFVYDGSSVLSVT